MDSLFESIMQLKENAGVSIAEYMKNWFNAYMTNTSWQSYQSQVFPMLQQIQDTYSQDRGKAAIKQLAKTALSISKLSPMPPKGAENIKQGDAAENNKAKDPVGDALKKIGAGGASSDEIKQQLDALEKTNPEAYKRAIAAKTGAS
jgi:hypothetical protein